ncbi:MAG: response regulator [Salinivirgaceae bacterium]|nr:response regulator [Salinivirgaceae bacterium]
MEKSKTKVYIIDDELKSNHPIRVKLEQVFSEVKLFQKASDAIAAIKESLGSKIILLLDLKLSGGESGYKTLYSLRNFSYQIPVIIWTAIDEKTSEFFSLINLKTYAIRDKDESNEKMVELVKQADADITYSLSNALERWILAQPGNHDDIFAVSTGGESYSLNQMLDEVRKDTPKGKEFTQDLVNLTIELMEKENHE